VLAGDELGKANSVVAAFLPGGDVEALSLRKSVAVLVLQIEKERNGWSEGRRSLREKKESAKNSKRHDNDNEYSGVSRDETKEGFFSFPWDFTSIQFTYPRVHGHALGRKCVDY
jgi:hypothetical protein